MYRTHKCNELRTGDLNKSVKLAGWTHSIRDHGGLLFIDLRDNSGLIQCVINSEKNQELIAIANTIKLESVILIEGIVLKRDASVVNPELETGEIEIELTSLTIESMAEQVPFQVNDEGQNYPEDLRLKYRYLDLRTKRMHNNIHFRNKVFSFLRKQMEAQNFEEFQTPILTVASPEGARDFLVPARLHPGKFYALPQAPQQFKQLLMMSGFDRYFQLAPCFRDEGSRSDRVLEFYQLDMEMSFVEESDIHNIMEQVIYNLFTTFSKKETTKPHFPRISFRESMLKYGSDKPDLRNSIEIFDVTEVFKDSDFSIFAKAINNGSIVRAIPANNIKDKPRSFFDKMVEFAISEGARGLGYIIFENGEAKGPVAKFLDATRLNKLKELGNLKDGDAVFFSCGAELDAAKMAGKVRIKLGQDLELINKNEYKFCWIVDFPFFEINEETGKLDFAHNPFSMPKGGLEALNGKDLLNIEAQQYDCVCNGYEICSGGIRNHKLEIMYKAFELVGYSNEVVDAKFGGLKNAFSYGAPPHGGSAWGIERLIMLLLDEPSLREIIPFPANGKGMDLMMGSPSSVEDIQLKELNIELSKKAKEEIGK